MRLWTAAMYRLLVLLPLLLVVSAGEDSGRPNIILILADDLGYSGLGCFGNRHVATPHLDRLAAEGVKATDVWVTPQCTPTRASLLTGQHTARIGMWHVPGYQVPHAFLRESAYVSGLPRGVPTIASVLRAAGYVTGCFGKWHLHQNGDGSYAGLQPAAANHYGFTQVHQGDHHKAIDKGAAGLTDEAIAFLEQHRAAPFFLYLSHYTVHTPVTASPAVIAQYRARGYPAAGPDGDEGRNNATFLAMIEELDTATGRLLAALDRLDLSRRTLVIFMSDNGGVLRVCDNGPLRAGKGTPYEGGLRVPFVARWPQHIPAGTVTSTPIHVTDLLPTLCEVSGANPPDLIDGRSVLPALTTGATLPERDQFAFMPQYEPGWQTTPCAVIRQGRFKLIEFFGDVIGEDGTYTIGRRVELYDLQDDIAERHDLSTTYADLAAAMHLRLQAWIRAMGREVPGPNPDYRASAPLGIERRTTP